MTSEMIPLWKRDLEKLIVQLELYPNESSIWKVVGEIKNSSGNLVLHLVGNLNLYIGVKLGGTDFVRDREAEFALRNLPRVELIHKVRQTLTMIEQVLPTVTGEMLEQIYPLEVLGYPMSTRYFLFHLYGHLNWHLGQVDYHRRLVAAS